MDQPLFNSLPVHLHLVAAARGDGALLPGGRLTAWSLRKQLPLQLLG